MDVWDTQVQMFFAADATILQVYNRAMDNWLWSFDICDRVFDGHGERLNEQARVVDLPAQPSQRRELTIRTSDISVYRKCLEKFRACTLPMGSNVRERLRSGWSLLSWMHGKPWIS